jgi:ABC-type transport system involved in cytochrome bd biosynthesis fused ATPase/permease subunit
MAFSVWDIMFAIKSHSLGLIMIYTLSKIALSFISLTSMRLLAKIGNMDTEDTVSKLCMFVVFTTLNLLDNWFRETSRLFITRKLSAKIAALEEIRFRNELLKRERSHMEEQLRGKSYRQYIDKCCMIILDVINTVVRSIVVIILFYDTFLYVAIFALIYINTCLIVTRYTNTFIKKMEKDLKLINIQKTQLYKHIFSLTEQSEKLEKAIIDTSSKQQALNVKISLFRDASFIIVPLLLTILDGIIGYNLSGTKENFTYYLSCSSGLWSLGFGISNVMYSISSLKTESTEVMTALNNLEKKIETVKPAPFNQECFTITKFKYLIPEAQSNGLSFELREPLKLSKGNIYCMYGKSGSGKTTFAKLFADELHHVNLTCAISSAEQILNNAEVPISLSKCSEYMEQSSPDVFPDKEIKMTLNEFLDLPKMSKETEYWIKALGLDDRLRPESDVSNSLSKGQKSRISLIRVFLRALKSKASLLILDEPDEGLDNENSLKMLQAIKDTFKDRIVIMICHNNVIPDDKDVKKIKIADGIILPEYTL